MMGSTVTATIRQEIAYISEYETEPEVLMYGMMCVLLAVGIWLLAATKLGLPVSTTHSTVGGIIGMSLVARGASSVNWGKDTERDFPFVNGVASIILSWVFSPILSGVVAALLFVMLRGCVLRTKESFRNSLVAFPIVVGCTITINVYFILVKGTSARAHTDEWEDGKLVGISFGVGLGATLAVALAMPPLTARIYALRDKELQQSSSGLEQGSGSIKGGAKGSEHGEGEGNGAFDAISEGDDISERCGPVWRHQQLETPGSEAVSSGAVSVDVRVQGRPSPRHVPAPTSVDQSGIVVTLGNALTESLNLSKEEVVKNSGEAVQAIHDNAEVFDEKSESVFGYMQVFSACCDSFAHGANDVANAVGPFAAIWGIYENGIAQESDVPLWILVVGGFGLVAGLWTYGAKIILQIGMRLSKITPSRGLCIELGAAIVVIVGTKFGIPLSTTHCQVGATTGVALLEGKGGVNWTLFAHVIFGWIMTLVVAALGAAAFTAQGLYAPHIHRFGVEEAFAAGVSTCSSPPPPPSL